MSQKIEVEGIWNGFAWEFTKILMVLLLVAISCLGGISEGRKAHGPVTTKIVSHVLQGAYGPTLVADDDSVCRSRGHRDRKLEGWKVGNAYGCDWEEEGGRY